MWHHPQVSHVYTAIHCHTGSHTPTALATDSYANTSTHMALHIAHSVIHTVSHPHSSTLLHSQPASKWQLGWLPRAPGLGQPFSAPGCEFLPKAPQKPSSPFHTSHPLPRSSAHQPSPSRVPDCRFEAGADMRGRTEGIGPTQQNWSLLQHYWKWFTLTFSIYFHMKLLTLILGKNSNEKSPTNQAAG